MRDMGYNTVKDINLKDKENKIRFGPVLLIFDVDKLVSYILITPFVIILTVIIISILLSSPIILTYSIVFTIMFFLFCIGLKKLNKEDDINE